MYGVEYGVIAVLWYLDALEPIAGPHGDQAAVGVGAANQQARRPARQPERLRFL